MAPRQPTLVVNLGESAACQDRNVMVVGTAEQEIEPGVATDCQAEDSQAPTLVVSLGESAACQDKNVLEIGTAEQVI